MAFRSELESARDRADAAEAEVKRLEAEIASQRARMERIQEVESQLEAARAAARVRSDDPKSVVPVLLTGLLLGVLGTVGARSLLHAGDEAEAERAADACAREREAAAREARDRLAAAEDVARAASDTLELERDAREAERAELGGVLLGLAADARGVPAPLHFGTVLGAMGPAPAGVGARCDLVASSEGPCLGALVCSGNVVHRFGCELPEPTHLRAHDGTVRVGGPLDWELTISTVVLPHGITIGPASPGGAPAGMPTVPGAGSLPRR